MTAATELEKAVRTELPADEQQAVLAFVHRFPKVALVPEPADVLDRFEATNGVTIPSWLRRFRTRIFAGSVQAPGVLECLVAAPGLGAAGEGGWLRVAPVPYTGPDELASLRDYARILHVACAIDGHELDLAVSFSEDDRRLYRYGYSLWEAYESKAPDPSVSYAELFSSFSDLLGHVTALRVGGKELRARKG